MKLTSTLRTLGLMAIVAALPCIISCKDKEDEPGKNVEKVAMEYDGSGSISSYCYQNKDFGPANLDRWYGSFNNTLNFSHTAGSETYAGVTYKYWRGFCPSNSTDRQDYTGVADWMDHQWSAIDAFNESWYMIGFWDTAEAGISHQGVCRIYRNEPFSPVSMGVTNTTYAYYSMKFGSAFSKAFGVNDWCKLTITGFLRGTRTGEIVVRLADGPEILSTVKKVDMTPLKQVDAIVFTMTSSDTGQWGMNNPAYFAIGDMTIEKQ